MENIVAAAKEAAREGGRIAMSLFGTARITEKSRINLVTDADIRSEDAITRILLDAHPGSVILGEESTSRQLTNVPALWVVDPLDGTNNYAHGIPLFSISIAYAEHGTVKAGVVYDPVHDELYEAQVGMGAYCNTLPLHTSAASQVEGAMISCGFHYDRGVLMEKTLASLHRLLKANIRGMRRTGSAAIDLCWVARGRFDAYFEYMLSPWDFAAGMLLVSESGGVCCDRTGLPLQLDSKGVIASCNGTMQLELLNHIRWE